MTRWLRILGGAYVVAGIFNFFVFLFILIVYGGKGGIDAIKVEEYLPVIRYLGGWVLYVLLSFSGASVLAGAGLLTSQSWFGNLALLLSVGNLFVLPFGTIIGLSTILTLFSKQGRTRLLSAPGKRLI